MNFQEKQKLLEEIKRQVLGCKQCSLYLTRTNPVFGEGDIESKIMFIGEAPGFNEDKQGVPFCGAAGKILDELLASVGIKRSDVYITNILKCRPPENRDPNPEEISLCTPYLERQIEIINPKVICSLGRYSMRYIFEKYGLKEKLEPISKIHGMVFGVQNLFQELKIIPFYHPAVATYNPHMKEILKRDFQILKTIK